MAVKRDELGLETRKEGNVLHVTVDTRVLQNTRSREALMELIVENAVLDGIHSIVILPRKEGL